MKRHAWTLTGLAGIPKGMAHEAEAQVTAETAHLTDPRPSRRGGGGAGEARKPTSAGLALDATRSSLRGWGRRCVSEMTSSRAHPPAWTAGPLGGC